MHFVGDNDAMKRGAAEISSSHDFTRQSWPLARRGLRLVAKAADVELEHEPVFLLTDENGHDPIGSMKTYELPPRNNSSNPKAYYEDTQGQSNAMCVFETPLILERKIESRYRVPETQKPNRTEVSVDGCIRTRQCAL